MRFFKISIVLLFLLHQSSLSAQLDQYRWDNRLLLIFASSTEDSQLKEQVQSLEKQSAALLDRALKVFLLAGQEGQLLLEEKTISTAQLAELRRRFKVSPADFQLLLIGKDGGVKLRSKSVVDPKEIFDLIDSMPMRQMEMRRKRKG